MRDLWRGDLSYRRLWVLLDHLPMDSWTQTALRDAAIEGMPAREQDPDKFGPWALLNYQVARLTDAVARVEYVTAAGKFDKVKLPEPTPRPGVKRQPVAQVDPKATEARVLYLNKIRARGVSPWQSASEA